MTDMPNSKASLGRAFHAISGKWGWFVALGFALGSRASRHSAQPATV
ncbi:hypothetical protein N2603_10030 [Bradyrhizobium huanghuaihaiense]|uniref:Uncharacterized protein n=1 Tax=Bradyrhizobium huanghuaihaiense TaxID=990078 RepID=A0A562RWN4_9BRAD|nr:hypothetical protein [Bradyrhizobium sp. CB3035]TWI72874.1 hypothetical protein IQ16_02453 [Bradyrhizobium huanghuaihaiense]UWU78766.1 hypothetical protein N2603_10030 [Bradyrhizobium sp. CB3035]